MNKFGLTLSTILALVVTGSPKHAVAAEQNAAKASRPKIITLDPPEKGFFTKEVFYHGIPVKAPAVVVNKALYAAYDRVAMELKNLPMITSNLAACGVEVHIIGRHQVTSDLPEFRHLKGKPLPEYHGLTIDQRTRGMGGRLTSCGEENLLKLKNDHYYGRDILVHEFAHAIRQYGIPL
ncbi:MAG TPA: hypothetical protein VKA67_00670, partial [Verrucomicrobiae bacterium]|nr:hypothetical protein [Verrucomicrobiae bacterium]